jgi:uncharacterized protein with HEPN domain
MRSGKAQAQDIVDAVVGIEQTLAGVAFATFAESGVMQRAIERGLEIISEASRALPEEDKARFPEVPWPQIAGVGNILRHEYHRVEPLIIWNITKTHLPALGHAVRRMLAEME